MIGERLKACREDAGLTQDQLAKIVHVSQQSVDHYEKNRAKPSLDTLNAFADLFDTTADYLIGRNDSRRPILENKIQAKTCHLVGRVRMGLPILTEENYLGELEIPSDIEADFALETEGDSMIGVGLLEGDYAICREAQTANSGDIVVALKDDGEYSEATLKYFFNGREKPVLRAANPRFKDIPFTNEWRIAGRLIGIIRKYSPSYHTYTSYLASRDVNMEKWEPVIEKAFQMGIKPSQISMLIDMVGKVAKE